MSYDARILADSVGPHGVRLTSFLVTFPRIVLAEFNTHRALSRSSASSRAIPVEKQIERVLADPFIPIYWGKNQKGMQAEQELDREAQLSAKLSWLHAHQDAITHARGLLAVGAHKQIVNRLLEPFMWHTVIVTATEWQNFFSLRCHDDAQPEIRRIALMMRELYNDMIPDMVQPGDWHLPLVDWDDIVNPALAPYLKEISAGRCARVSYLTHEGRRDPTADIDLCQRLIASGHMSPLEHPAECLPSALREGNFVGWRQYRKLIPGEDVFMSRQTR